MYELLYRARAYGDTFYGVEAIGKGVAEGSLRPKIPGQWRVEVTSLLQACWDDSPRKRPSFTEVSIHLRRWRNDPKSSVLTAIAAGSKKGLLEKLGLEECFRKEWGEHSTALNRRARSTSVSEGTTRVPGHPVRSQTD